MAPKTGFITGASRGIEAGIITAILVVANGLMTTAYEQNTSHQLELQINTSTLSLDNTVETRM